MAYKLKDEAQNFEPIPGIPWGPGTVLTEAEFENVSAEYDAQFPDQPGSLAKWFERVTDASPADASAPAVAKKR